MKNFFNQITINLTRINLTRKLSQSYLSLGVLVLSTILTTILTTTCITNPANATGVYDLPAVTGGDSVWVIDQADVISLASENKLNNTFNNLAQETGKEVRMVAIRRLEYGETIEGLADSIFSKWYASEDLAANQVLIVLDTLTNNIAIRTGDGAQNLVTDEIASSITSETMTVPIKDGNQYNEAFLDASDRLVAVLSGNQDPGPPVIGEVNVEGTYTSAEETDDKSATVWVIGFLIVATIIPMVTYFWYVGFPGN